MKCYKSTSVFKAGTLFIHFRPVTGNQYVLLSVTVVYVVPEAHGAEYKTQTLWSTDLSDLGSI